MPRQASFTPEEVAKLFEVSIFTVRDWINNPNGLMAIRVGKRKLLYISEEEVRRFYYEKYGIKPPDPKPRTK